MSRETLTELTAAELGDVAGAGITQVLSYHCPTPPQPRTYLDLCPAG